jgi:hypothetical protein
MNKQPICDNPVTGSMETLSGYRLCCNPAHSSEHYGLPGPVWHPMSEWPPNLPKEQLELEAFEKWWSEHRDDEDADHPRGAAELAWFARSRP